jgi:hypothetical protein
VRAINPDIKKKPRRITHNSIKRIKSCQIHLLIIAGIFIIFFLGVVLIKTWYLSWLLIPLIIINHFILIIRRKGGHFINTILLTCSLLVFFIFIEYIASVIGCFFSFILFIRFFFISSL